MLHKEIVSIRASCWSGGRAKIYCGWLVLCDTASRLVYSSLWWDTCGFGIVVLKTMGVNEKSGFMFDQARLRCPYTQRQFLVVALQ